MIRSQRPAAALLLISLIGAATVLPPTARAQSRRAPSTASAAASRSSLTPADTILARLTRESTESRSRVMSTLSYLTDVIGPRLTATPAGQRASNWVQEELGRQGISRAWQEPWQNFGEGWTLERFTAQMTHPEQRPLEIYPKAWSPDVKLDNVEIVWVEAATAAELEAYRGKLRGKVVLSGPMRNVELHTIPEAKRHTPEGLLAMACAHHDDEDAPTMPPPTAPANQEASAYQRQMKARMILAQERARFFAREGVAMILEPSRTGDGGNIFVQQATAVGPVGDTSSLSALYRTVPRVWSVPTPEITPQAVCAIELYNRLCRMTKAGEGARLSVELVGRRHAITPVNVIGEIPGTDPTAGIVMLGAHLDSWHGGTGATDNGCGVAAVMEAMRLIAASGIKTPRTIRCAFWSGEEQGLYGSRAYVARHIGRIDTAFARQNPGRPSRIIPGPDYHRLSVYYNLDNGAGRIRGIYAQRNRAAAERMRPWLTRLTAQEATVVTTQSTGGTDHIPFDDVGVPGFQFIQDELEYFSRTWHSTQDLYDRAPPEDMRQAALVMAYMALRAAQDPTMMPRKPLPGGLAPAAGKRPAGAPAAKAAPTTSAAGGPGGRVGHP